MNIFRSMGIRAKITAGIGTVLVILITVSGTAIHSVGQITRQFENYSQRVKVVAIARQLDRDAIDLRRFAREYALTGKSADALNDLRAT